MHAARVSGTCRLLLEACRVLCFMESKAVVTSSVMTNSVRFIQLVDLRMPSNTKPATPSGEKPGVKP